MHADKLGSSQGDVSCHAVNGNAQRREKKDRQKSGVTRQFLQEQIDEAGKVHRADPARAAALLESVLAQTPEDYPEIHCQILLARTELARMAQPGGDHSHLLLAAMRIVDQHNLTVERITVLNAMGIACSENHQTNLAIMHLSAAMEIAQKLENDQLIGHVSNNFGIVYSRAGTVATAVRYFMISLDHCRKKGDMRGQGSALSNIGTLYKQIGEVDLAIEYLERSIPLREAVNDRVGVVVTWLNLADCLKLRNDHRQAVEYLKRAESSAKTIGLQLSAIVAVRLAYTLAITGDKDAARRRLRQLKCFDTEATPPFQRNEYLYFNAAALYELGEYQEGLQHIRSALSSDNGGIQPSDLETFHRLLAKLLVAVGQHDEAQTHLRLADLKREEQRSLTVAREMRNLLQRGALMREELKPKPATAAPKQRFGAQERLRDALEAHLRSTQTLDNIKCEIESNSAVPNSRQRELAQETLTTIREALKEPYSRSLPQEYLDKVQAGTIQRLRERAPLLSKTELRICVLILMDFASKDIARVLACAATTIASHRTNIRRKLNLPARHNLTDHLNMLLR